MSLEDDKKKIVALGESTKAADRQKALDLIVDRFFKRHPKLKEIVYDSSFKSGAYDIETGFARLGAAQTIKVGPKFFTQWRRRVDRRIRTVGHELVHVEQRTQKKPIKNKHTREFLAVHWTITAKIKGVRSLGRAQTLQYITQPGAGALAKWKKMPEADKSLYKKQHEEVLKIQESLTRTGSLETGREPSSEGLAYRRPSMVYGGLGCSGPRIVEELGRSGPGSGDSEADFS